MTALIAAVAIAANPYGVHAHMQGRDRPLMERVYALVQDVGIGTLRTDCYWAQLQTRKDGPFDFSSIDPVVDCGLRHGVDTELILYSAPTWARPEWKHPEAYRAYVRATVGHLGDRVKCVEIHNEENASCFWLGTPDPTNYVRHLKIAYETVKSVNPRIQVALGGVAGCDAARAFLEGVYAAGGKDFFDVMNVHPYVHPNPPEINFDGQIDRLRELMARYGDAAKPIIASETGFPTHRGSDISLEMLAAGLRVARPEKKTWNVVVVESRDARAAISQDFARHLEKFLPPGSRAACGIPRTVRTRLAAGDVDAVVNPFSEGYFAELMDALVDFVKNGGTLADFGGMPMWFAMRCNGQGVSPLLDYTSEPSQDRRRLRIGVTAHWIDSNVPRTVRCQATPDGVAAGVKLPPDGFVCEYFLTPEFLQAGDAFIPLVAGSAKDGRPLTAAAVVRFGSDFKGRLVLSSMNHEAGVPYQPVDEARQALYLAREMGIAFAQGLARVVWYDLRAREENPGYSEHHFGIAHRDLSPKPALRAYAAFIARRPAGSVQLKACWRNDARTEYAPQWTRPDGRAAGMLWRTGGREMRMVAFDVADVKFFDVLGAPLNLERCGACTWRVPVGESPVYFEGGRLASPVGNVRVQTRKGT